MAFKAAAALAVRDALKTVEIDILEPFFKVGRRPNIERSITTF
jgi:hypothetical protein